MPKKPDNALPADRFRLRVADPTFAGVLRNLRYAGGAAYTDDPIAADASRQYGVLVEDLRPPTPTPQPETPETPAATPDQEQS